MASLITHPLVPIVVAAVLGHKHVPSRLMLLGVVFSVLPDLDVVAFHVGVPYADPFGHRGFTHSLMAAALAALAVIPFAEALRATRTATFVFLLASMASHGALDALTRHGLGVAFFWPFDDSRYFFPFHPVESSPLSISRFLHTRAGPVLQSEFIWLWVPLLAVALLGCIVRKLARPAPPQRLRGVSIKS